MTRVYMQLNFSRNKRHSQFRSTPTDSSWWWWWCSSLRPKKQEQTKR